MTMIPPCFGSIASDRYLTPDEVAGASGAHPLIAPIWDLYAAHFQGFTASTLDPQFHRLSHPAVRTGRVQIEDGTTVLVVGTGPSLRRNLDELRRVREHLRIFTSPRGAEALLGHGIVPDLVLVEHQTPLDAHHSLRHLGDGGDSVLAACPLVAADWRTPRALLAGVEPDRLFVPSPLPTWGLWPATAAAMAIDAGAARVALLGIDLGTADAPDPAHAPLRALLETLAAISGAAAFDCGDGGASKLGWTPAAIGGLGGGVARGMLGTSLQAAPDERARRHETQAGLHELSAVVRRARRLREWATEAAAVGRGPATTVLEAAVGEIVAWRHEPRLRVLLQECLGVSFLPRFWRIGIDRSLGLALWRPLMLATHELTAQADALSHAVAGERMAA
jgi:hypothetical protein